MTEVVATTRTIQVVGGGISGVTAALEAAECGKDMVLVEKSPTVGGRTTLLYRYFPRLCHPTRGFEINQGQINKTYGTRFNMPVVYYSQPMTLADGGSAKEAGIDGQVIRSKKLEEIAVKVVKK